MLRQFVCALSMVLLVASIGVSVAAAQVSLQANEPAAILSAFEAARNRGDIDTAMTFFADDALPMI